jgi:signal transduction histidine kinase
MLERARIAGELHDTLLQGFTGALMQLEALRTAIAPASPEVEQRLSSIIQQAQSTLRETRQMVWGLRSSEHEMRDLAQALTVAARSIDGGVTELRYVERGAPRRLSAAAKSTMLRIGREAVTNAIKHAQARTVDVELAYEPRAVHLTVRDDGRGASDLELNGASANGHWGVADMRTRASGAGANLQIVSSPGEGTRVALSVPVGASRG